METDFRIVKEDTNLSNRELDGYGSKDWFISAYDKVDDDPWGLSWRLSQQVRYARILRLLDSIGNPPPSILDIGCATGDFTYLLKTKYGQQSVVTGVDFIESAVQRAGDRYPQLQFKVASIFDVGSEYEGQMDLVTCLEVLYYLERKECARALASISKALRPGGIALFSSMISKHPYFSLDELEGLVSTEFALMRSDTVHVKLLSLGERVIVKLETLGKRHVGIHHDPHIARRLLGIIPFKVGVFLERYSRYLGALSASHALVLAKRA